MTLLQKWDLIRAIIVSGLNIVKTPVISPTLRLNKWDRGSWGLWPQKSTAGWRLANTTKAGSAASRDPYPVSAVHKSAIVQYLGSIFSLFATSRPKWWMSFMVRLKQILNDKSTCDNPPESPMVNTWLHFNFSVTSSRLLTVASLAINLLRHTYTFITAFHVRP